MTTETRPARRQTDRQADRQTDRQTDCLTDRDGVRYEKEAKKRKNTDHKQTASKT